MSLEFKRAPVIGRDRVHGVYAEGSYEALAPDARARFEEVVQAWGRLVPANQEMSGQSFVALLREANAPQRDIECAAAVMQLEGDGTARSPDHSARAAEAAIAIAASLGAQIQVLNPATAAKDLDPAMLQEWVVRAIHPFGLPPNWAIAVRDEPGAGLYLRVCDLLHHSPVGPETFDVFEAMDSEAQFRLMSILANSRGYGAWLTGNDGVSGQRTPPVVKPDDGMPMTPESVQAGLRSFLASFQTTDWESKKKPVFLARPAPIVNPLASMRPYESLMGPFVVWRLPSALVQREFDALRPHDQASEEEGDAAEAASPMARG